MDVALRCAHDQDDNGLDDEMELELGRCLAPAFRFHSGHIEPPTRVLFNAHAKYVIEAGPHVGATKVMLHYDYLWPSDLGFTQMDCTEKAESECTPSWDDPS